MSYCDREKKIFERSMSNTLISHTNAHAVSGRPTLKGVKRFRTRARLFESGFTLTWG